MDWSRMPVVLVSWALGAVVAGLILWFVGVIPDVPGPLIGLGVALVIAGVGGLFWLTVVGPRRERGAPRD